MKVIFAPVSFYRDIEIGENSYWDYRYCEERTFFIETTLPFLPMPNTVIDFEDMKEIIYKDWRSKLLRDDRKINNIRLLIERTRKKFNILDTVSDCDIFDIMFGKVPHKSTGTELMRQYGEIDIFRVWRVSNYYNIQENNYVGIKLSMNNDNTVFVPICME